MSRSLELRFGRLRSGEARFQALFRLEVAKWVGAHTIGNLRPLATQLWFVLRICFSLQ